MRLHFFNSAVIANSKMDYFKNVLDALAVKHLCLWCELQSQLLFSSSLLLKNFLTALVG